MSDEKFVLPDNIFERWESTCSFEWDDVNHTCAECLGPFKTGDVGLVFGDMDVTIAKKFYTCAECGYRAILSGHVPAATHVFVEDAHRRQKLSHLPDEARIRVMEAFVIVDRIHVKMAELVEQFGCDAIPKKSSLM